MKILHIVGWYPSDLSPLDGIFIKEHIKAFSKSGIPAKVYHIQISKGEATFVVDSNTELTRFILKHPFIPWFLCELVSSLLVFLVILTNRKSVNVINFHLAYPNLTYWSYFKWIAKDKRVICIEHWSAYGLNFGLQKSVSSQKKLSKVRDIFKNNIRFVFVSNHLKSQVEEFANYKISKSCILPNVVDDLFKFSDTPYEELAFFSAAVWRKGKRPLEMIKGFDSFSKSFPSAKLYIAGDGDLVPEMMRLVQDLQASNIIFLGRLFKNELASVLKNIDAVCHSSDHETFSVICAEALVAGKPLIFSRLPAVEEYADTSNSVMVESISNEGWETAFRRYQALANSFDRPSIAKEAISKFSYKAVAEKYRDIVSN